MYFKPPIVAGSAEDGGEAGYKLCGECGNLTFLSDLETLCITCRPGPLPPGITRRAPDEAQTSPLTPTEQSRRVPGRRPRNNSRRRPAQPENPQQGRLDLG